MWKHSSTDRPGMTLEFGVITPEYPPAPELPEGFTIERALIITPQDTIFYAKNSKASEVNNTLHLSPMLGCNATGIFRAKNAEGEQVGFIIGIKHDLLLAVPDHADEFLRVTSSLTTCLVVDEAYRGQKIAELLIKTQMAFGSEVDVLTGYFYGLKPRTLSAIPVSSWYRLIDVLACKELGYAITLPKTDEVVKMHPTDQLKLAKTLYRVRAFGHLTTRPTEYADFATLQKRKIGVLLTEEMFAKLSEGAIKWYTIVGSAGTLVCAYRPYPLTNLSGKKIEAGLLVYCETSEPFEDTLMKQYLDSMFFIAKSSGFVAVHGIAMGCLQHEDQQFLGPLYATISGLMFVDFWNLCTGRLRDAREVSLMYV